MLPLDVVTEHSFGSTKVTLHQPHTATGESACLLLLPPTAPLGMQLGAMQPGPQEDHRPRCVTASTSSNSK